MIFDAVVGVFILAAIISGYRDGFIRSLLRTAGYIAGAIAGLYLALQFDQSAWIILAIFVGAGLGSWLGSLVAKALKLTIIRGPLAWLNSLTGALLEAIKVAVLAYLVGTVLLWAPWPTAQNEVAESKIYLQISTHAPSALNALREKVESYFPNPL